MRALAAFAALLLLVAACRNDTDTDPPLVVAGPALAHTPPAGVREGDPLTFVVDADDPEGVRSVEMWHRVQGTVLWASAPLASEDGSRWTVTLEGEDVGAPGVQYYFRAVDDSEYAVSSQHPAEGRAAPLLVAVGVHGLPLPQVWDFEGDVGVRDLWGHGWAEYTEADRGATWALSQSRARSGTVSVFHRRGQVGSTHDDWLVSPPLDLGSVERAQVTWWENGEEPSLATHTLWISTGSPDPARGDYVLVASLDPPPERRWARTRVHDLSEWAGAEVAYLAWRYEGGRADGWFVDDVEVRALGADLELVDVSWEPVEPGGTTLVTLVIENRTDIDATDVVLVPSAEGAQARFVDTSVEVGTVAGRASVELELLLEVGLTHPNHAYLPFLVVADSATDSWSWTGRIVVGEASTAVVELTTSGTGLVEVRLGVGEVGDPTLLLPVRAGVLGAGTHQLEFDLTDHPELLPPSPGPGRWFASVSSATAGTLDRFDIQFGGEVFASDDTGPFRAGEDAVFHLPRRPAPVVASSRTSPSQVRPGDTVRWTFDLENRGHATTGRTTVTLRSDDPDVTVRTTSPVLLAADGWAEGALSTVSFDVDVATSQVDSRPVPFELLVEDAAEAFLLRRDLDVPWPVLAVTAVRIDDWRDGNDDGLLDPGETAFLHLDLTNVGGLDTFFAVHCELVRTGGSAGGSVLVATGAFGLVRRGETKDQNSFQVRVTSGAVGDDLAFELRCGDGTAEYVSTFTIVLGEPPWLALAVFGDRPDDAVGGYPFDIVNGLYRNKGGVLEILLESSTPFDPATLFLEMWGRSTGAAYTWYQITFQSGKGTARGYSFPTFTTLSHPTVTAVGSHEVLLAIDLEPLKLVLRTARFGFAAGFCPGAYFCDQFPDDWGLPYATDPEDGLDDSRMLQLNW